MIEDFSIFFCLNPDVGGVPEAVIHEATGFIFNKTDSPGSIAKWIVSTWEDKLKYATLCRNAYSRCIKVMNWDSWSQKVKEIVEIELK